MSVSRQNPIASKGCMSISLYLYLLVCCGWSHFKELTYDVWTGKLKSVKQACKLGTHESWYYSLSLKAIWKKNLFLLKVSFHAFGWLMIHNPHPCPTPISMEDDIKIPSWQYLNRSLTKNWGMISRVSQVDT